MDWMVYVYSCKITSHLIKCWAVSQCFLIQHKYQENRMQHEYQNFFKSLPVPVYKFSNFVRICSKYPPISKFLRAETVLDTQSTPPLTFWIISKC